MLINVIKTKKGEKKDKKNLELLTQFALFIYVVQLINPRPGITRSWHSLLPHVNSKILLPPAF